MDPQRLMDLCHEHATAEGRSGADYDPDAILATLVAEPRFEFFPLAKGIRGRANIELFYREQYPRFGPRVTGYEIVGEWTNEIAALQEYVLTVNEDDGSQSAYHVISMMPGDDESGLLTGERLYCDEGFVRALLGPLFEHLEPLGS